jgi:uncharacterized protein (TIGR00369 family)
MAAAMEGRMQTGTILDRYPMPPCAAHLGWRMLGHDAPGGWVRIAFEGRDEFRNISGFVQGGMLAAMLDDAMGPAIVLMTQGRCSGVTVGMNLSYLAPARPGTLVCEAKVVQLGKSIGFVEGTLSDGEGVVVARATAHVRLVPLPQAPPA